MIVELAFITFVRLIIFGLLNSFNAFEELTNGEHWLLEREAFMKTAELVSKILLAKYHQLCPECGDKMIETDRTNESGIIFVWYKCSNKECQGQWLQKMSGQLALSGITAGQGAI